MLSFVGPAVEPVVAFAVFVVAVMAASVPSFVGPVVALAVFVAASASASTAAFVVAWAFPAV